jgi:hypothetical protein
MTRMINFAAIGFAFIGALSFGTHDAVAQPRPSPVPSFPSVRPALPPQPPAAPFLSDRGDVDVDFEWEFDIDGLGDSARESARAATEAARQAIADMKWRMEFDGQRKGAGGAESREETWYRHARESLDRDRYEQALETLDRIISAPGNPYSDAAMYWKAYALVRLRRNADALGVLADMQKRFPESRWIKDAKALEVETREASGQTVSPDAQHDEELKLLALRGLMRTDPDRAMPMVEKLMSGSSSVKLRENAMFVLSQSRSPKAREIIAAVAKTGNPDLQIRAIRYLGAMNGNGQNVQILRDIYRSTSDLAAKRAVIDSLARNPQGARPLADLARAEKDPNLKKLIVSRLSNMSSPDATEYLLELFK